MKLVWPAHHCSTLDRSMSRTSRVFTGRPTISCTAPLSMTSKISICSARAGFAAGVLAGGGLDSHAGSWTSVFMIEVIVEAEGAECTSLAHPALVVGGLVARSTVGVLTLDCEDVLFHESL